MDSCEQLCFDLHAWFKQSPCKEEDYCALRDDICIEDSSLFLCHVNTRWLTLLPALVRVSERWEDTEKYFLTFLPFKKSIKDIFRRIRDINGFKLPWRTKMTRKCKLHFWKTLHHCSKSIWQCSRLTDRWSTWFITSWNS